MCSNLNNMEIVVSGRVFPTDQIASAKYSELEEAGCIDKYSGLLKENPITKKYLAESMEPSLEGFYQILANEKNKRVIPNSNIQQLTAVYTREDFEKFYGKSITQNVLGKDYQLLLEAPKIEDYLKKDQ